MPPAKAVLTWLALAAALAIPLAVAATSPLLEWRGPVYIAAGLAGVVALALMLLQPLLAAGLLPGLPPRRGRRVHRWTGVALVLAVLLHVAGLWVTSPPDVIDALLFASPTPFTPWGVLAMWAVFAAALLAALRARLSPRTWRLGHTALIAIAVTGALVHALLIEGTMSTLSKAALCLLTAAATAKAIADLRAWRMLRRRA
ncbi:ferric reductase-like transmembrane domain-containing protein [Oceaniglobus roseus]|uniref:ferric reductase-like transmembrane domain-containing protein n=1 Tax=Oceaniglobus roseus TaxID=1737570 RepID=UPI000C7EEC85|nr:ferric reductase-like transmembrane domain-containing protein [Kandeliimicrobium roseum]